MSVKIEDKESIEYWKDRAAFLESVIYELREAIKDEREDETSRISQLEIGLGQIYNIVERLVKGGYLRSMCLLILTALLTRRIVPTGL